MEPFVESFDRAFVGEQGVIFASGGVCAPIAPMYDFGPYSAAWSDGWPRRFVPFPTVERVLSGARRAQREARYRIRGAWKMLRHGSLHDDTDDW